MSRAFSFCVAPLLLLLLGANTQERPRLTFAGLGDIQIGMTSDQVKALGFRLTSSGPWEKIGDPEFVACHYLDSSLSFPGVAVMMSDNQVVRIDIGFRSAAENWQSLSGAKIGMSQTDVKAIYGDWLQISRHPYLDDAGSYLTLTSSDGQYAMIFETSAKDMTGNVVDAKTQVQHITDFRAGLADYVRFIEGCA
ncbi:hypothetical protein [Parasphingorhabdus sp.]|uniref:hypothetical protein n=1 Tax=Parasphingorhabdus sp. TaxID=2709688 RepID=UPI003265861B